MRTFSQIIDEMIDELKRPDMRATLVSYLNTTVRELHKRSSGGIAVHYGENRVETTYEITETPIVWEIPSPQQFQDLETIYVPTRGVYLTKSKPGVALRPSDNPLDRFYYYRTGPAFALAGLEVGESVNISYFAYPPRLEYAAVADRVCWYDPSVESYVVADSWAGTDAEAKAKVTNWLLERYGDELREGVRVKIYRRLNNPEQASQSHLTFEAAKMAIQLAEGME